jgi:peptidoglycan hydrolase-like protein with peptidoglycan-binding domain
LVPVSRRAVVVGTAVGLVLLAGVLVGASLAVDGGTDSPMSSDVEAEPLLVPVTASERSVAVGVGVTVVDEPGQEVISGRAGTVTGVAATVGDTLESGDILARVDDRPIVGMVTSSPLWRDLSESDTGPDVKRLQKFLRQVDRYEGPVNGTFGAATRRAVAAFNASVGRRDLGGRFSLETVAWLGPESLTVSEVSARPGQAVAVGAALLRGPDRPVAIAVAEPVGGVPGDDGGHELVVGDVRAPYVAGSGTVTDPDDVAALAGAVGSTGEGIGQVVSAVPRTVLVVPSSAVVVDAAGTTCVFTDVDGPGTVVAPTGGGLATVELQPDVGVSEVLANPHQVRSEVSCS